MGFIYRYGPRGCVMAGTPSPYKHLDADFLLGLLDELDSDVMTRHT